jgi:hypothetical protein
MKLAKTRAVGFGESVDDKARDSERYVVGIKHSVCYYVAEHIKIQIFDYLFDPNFGLMCTKSHLYLFIFISLIAMHETKNHKKNKISFEV